MSAILAVCGDTFCAMVSDGRYVEEPITGEKPHILKNDLPKVRKINRNVVVGFAGDTLAAVQIINAVDEYQTQYLTLEKVVKILREKAATVSVQPVGVRLIVGGRNRKGVFTMTMMAALTATSRQTQAPASAYLIRVPAPTPTWPLARGGGQAAGRQLAQPGRCGPYAGRLHCQDGQARQEHQHHVFPSACNVNLTIKGEKLL